MNAGEKSLLKALDQGGIVALFFQPLLHEDDNKHSCYHKIQTVCIELKQIAHQTADGCSAESVKMVE